MGFIWELEYVNAYYRLSGKVIGALRFSLCCFQREAGGGAMRDPSFQTYLSHRLSAIADPLEK
jgi:hypothetical protein